ncbi:glycosyltransferase family 4 protein [Desulfonatronum parangueonense]
MAKKLKTLGHDVSFFYPVDISKRQPGEDKTPYAVVSTEYEGLKVHQINVVDGSTNLFENPQYMFANETVEQQFEELLRREQFDLVHFHLLYRLSSRLPLAAKSLNIPTAATLHDYWLLCAMGHLIDTKGRECSGPESPEKCARCLGGFQADPSKGIVEFFRLRQQVNLAGYEALDRKYSPSKHLADVHARYGFSRPAVLPLGWPAVQAPRTNPAQKDKIVLGFIGQIVYRKGLDLLVKALNGLDAILRDKCELHIHGTVQQPQFYDTVMDTVKDNPVVKFFGPYKQDDLGSILSSFDVTVIPSRQENYPLTVLESLSAKVPVIASDVGGVREMFQDKVEGFLFPREDTTRLAKIIRMLLTQPDLLASMRTKIRPIKTMRQNAEEYARVYEEMMKT